MTLPKGRFLLALAAVAAAAAYLRLTSINWGAPFLYHPDEHFVLHRALDVVRTGDPNPRWFEYPSFLIYFQAFLIAVLQPFVGASLESNHLLNGIGPWDALPEQWPFVLAGRIGVALFAVAGVMLVGVAGRRMFGAPAGIVAAAFLAAAPMHNNSAHYLLTDVPASTFVAASLCAAVAERPRWLLAGLLAGLAAGTKYTAGLAFLTAAVLALGSGRWEERISHLSRLFIGAVAGFLASTPFALVDAPEFWRGIAAQRSNYLRGFDWGNNWQWYLRFFYDRGLGPAIAVIAGLGVVRAAGDFLGAVRGRAGALHGVALVVPMLLYFPWLSSYPARAERNLLLLIPYLCLLAAAALQRVAALLPRERLGRALFAAVAATAVVISVQKVQAQNERYARADTRTHALRWIESHVPAGAKLAREEYTPQVPPGPYDVTYVWSLAWRPYDWYLNERVEYLVASSHVYDRALGAQKVAGKSGGDFYRLLFTLPLEQEFRPGAGVKGPTIRIYRVPAAAAEPEIAKQTETADERR